MYFSREMYKFLSELSLNNNKEWFHANKQRYEDHIKEPSLRFIADFAPRLADHRTTERRERKRACPR